MLKRDDDGDDGVVKAEAERLRQQREMQHEEEFSQLMLADEELVQVSILSVLPVCRILYILAVHIICARSGSLQLLEILQIFLMDQYFH